MTASVPPRKGQLGFVEVSGTRHLQLLASNGHSAEVSGRIESQYEKKLRSGDPSAGAFGIEACGRLVGSLSWGEVVLPANRGISGRLDTVVSNQKLRGNGLGALLMAEFVRLMSERYGDKLVHLSTIAMHPSVAHTVGKIGFHSESLGDTPLWQVDLRAPDCPDVVRLAKISRQKHLTVLKQKCVKCTRHAWEKAWCMPKESKS